MEQYEFRPFNMGGLEAICEKILSNPTLNKYFVSNSWDDLAVSWEGMFLHQAYHYLKSIDWEEYDERLNSVLYSCLETQTMQYEWMIYSLLHGQYELVLRELRNIVESAFLFYRMDYYEEYRKKSGEEKFNELKGLIEKEFGRKVFEQSGYADWEKVYKDLYRPLCEYTHTKISLVRNETIYPYYNGMLEPTYDEKKVVECMYYLQQTMALEVDMMCSILEHSYGIDDTRALRGIFDNVIIPKP